jgi:hypothetical protein
MQYMIFFEYHNFEGMKFHFASNCEMYIKKLIFVRQFFTFIL